MKFEIFSLTNFLTHDKLFLVETKVRANLLNLNFFYKNKSAHFTFYPEKCLPPRKVPEIFQLHRPEMICSLAFSVSPAKKFFAAESFTRREKIFVPTSTFIPTKNSSQRKVQKFVVGKVCPNFNFSPLKKLDAAETICSSD